MKKSDLYREWARVLDMCEGTGVSPSICWGFEGGRTYKGAPELSEDPNGYEFAVAILENKPVFVGDYIYSKQSGVKYQIKSDGSIYGQSDTVGNWRNIIIGDMFSWDPPKKTFLLNGVELPCPQRDYSSFNLDFNSWSSAGRKNGSRYYFKSESDLCEVTDKIHKLLQDATK